ncbi:MAG: hypothetical protein LUF82_05790 [Clostridia bacterium]|nr:hypothetical protein [Clostridia bacterium]
MVKYIKCPRCELNYIDSEKQEYCDVCIAEMKGNRLQFADFDEDEDDLESKLELCPICGINTVRYGEKMCDACKKASEYEDEQEVNLDTDEEWKNYLEDDEDLTLDDEEIDEELSEELDAEFADDDEEEDEDFDDDDDDDEEDDDDDDLF